MLYKKLAFLEAAGLTFFIVGCALPWHEPARMVPDISTLELKSTQHSIKIGNIKSGEVRTSPLWLGKESHIRPDQLESALRESLKRSAIVRFVGEGGYSDYRLDAQIVSQQLEPGFVQSQKLFVHYDLIDLKTNKTVWSDSYLTQFDATIEQWGLQGRLKAANEGAVRDSISRLLRDLSEYFQGVSP